MTRRNATDSHAAATRMAATDQLVRDATTALTAMVSSMEAIGASSQKVSSIIKTIDEIALQTNILALNAAVEAARAGQSGAGFAIVADEVRSLALRSARAARDTAALIEESIANAAEGHDRVAQLTTTIEAIAASARTVKELIDSVSAASRQQSRGIEHVSAAVTALEHVAHTNAAAAEQGAAASEELSAQAKTVIQVVGRLAALVDDERAGRAHGPAWTHGTLSESIP
jgi:methyl-accepting chemotaxis protein